MVSGSVLLIENMIMEKFLQFFPDGVFGQMDALESAEMEILPKSVIRSFYHVNLRGGSDHNTLKFPFTKSL